VRFTVHGLPKPQPRVKARNLGKHAGVYTPSPKGFRKWQALVTIAAKAMPDFPRPPLVGPVRIDRVWFLPRPQRLMRKKDPVGPIPMDNKRHGDIDNLDKLLLDTLTKANVWEDDGQVCQGEPQKWWVAKYGEPGLVVVINGRLDLIPLWDMDS